MLSEDRAAMPARLPFVNGLSLLAIFVSAGFVLRCWKVDTRSLWFDEAFSWRVATFPLGELLERTGGDNHPPLHFLLLKAWMGLWGESELSLRMLSVSAGVASCVGMFLLVREVYRSADGAESIGRGARVGTDQGNSSAAGMALLAAALVAVSVFQIRWGREARMYTLAAALATFSSWALWRALQAEPKSWRAWTVFGLLALAFVYTHYYAFFTIAGQMLFAAGYLGWQWHGLPAARLQTRQNLSGLGLAILIVGLGFLPWVPQLLNQRSQVQAAFWARAIGWHSVPFVLYQMFVEPEDAAYSVTANALATVFVIGVLAVLMWRPTAGDWFLFLGVTVPIGGSVLVTLFDTRIFHLRYFLFCHLFLLAALARVVWKLLSGRLERGLVSAWLVATGLLINFAFWDKMDIAHRPGVKGATAWIHSSRQVGEPVIVCSPLYLFPVLYHLPGRSGCFLYNDGTPVVHYEGGAAVLPEDLISPERMRGLKSHRAWIVNTEGGFWGKRTVPVPASWRLLDSKSFLEAYGVQGNVVVLLYETQASGSS